MSNTNQSPFILQENLWKVMFKLSWPAVLGMVLYGLNVVFDAIFVGRFVGESAFAGVSLAFPLIQIPLGIGQLIGGGAGAVLSIAIGSKNVYVQKKILGNVNFLTLILSLIFMVLGLTFSTSLIRMMGGTGTELAFGDDYFRTCMYGAFFWVAGLAGNLIVRAEGKMKTAALMMAIGLIVNIIATYLLIVVFDMGVKGAAIGTNIGMAVYTLTFLIYVLTKNATFDAILFTINRDKEMLKDILSNGAPLFIMSVMLVVQGVVVFNVLTKYGTTSDIAFYGAVYRVMSFMLMPTIGLMRSLQPTIGINFGAQQYDRVIQSYRIWTIASALLIFPFWILLMLFPETSMNVILPAQALSNVDISNFRFFMAPLPFLAIVFMGMTFFPAINKGNYAAIIGLARQLLLFVPVMLIFPRFWGVEWVYIGAFIIDVIVILWTVQLIAKEVKLLKKSTSKISA